MKRFLSMMIATVTLTGLLAGCGSSTQGRDFSELSQAEPKTEAVVLKQFGEPAKGSEIATIKTNQGEIQVMFFPEEAPKAVENFITHAKNGYYNGMIFHRVIQDFMIQGGSPNGDGTGGESIWGQPFEDEFSDSLHHFRGALAMANSGVNTNGSQFFIVQSGTPITGEEELENALLNMYFNKELYDAQLYFDQQVAAGKSNEELNKLADELNAQLSEKIEQGVPAELKERLQPVLEKYKEVGGTPHLDNKHTVFGQVIVGMDVVDKIAALPTDGSDKPLEAVVIESITFSVVE